MKLPVIKASKMSRQRYRSAVNRTRQDTAHIGANTAVEAHDEDTHVETVHVPVKETVTWKSRLRNAWRMIGESLGTR